MSLSQTELDSLRSSANETMQDTCTFGTQTAIGTATGPEPYSGTWTYGTTAYACGFNANMSREVADGNHTSVTDAVIRVPLSCVITAENRIAVTKRNGEAITTEYYGIIGAPRRGQTALVCNCRRVQGNSTT